MVEGQRRGQEVLGWTGGFPPARHPYNRRFPDSSGKGEVGSRSQTGFSSVATHRELWTEKQVSP